MSYTPLGDFGQQGLFDITRILLQQPDLASLSETLTRWFSNLRWRMCGDYSVEGREPSCALFCDA
jgi:hypothetical protein